MSSARNMPQTHKDADRTNATMTSDDHDRTQATPDIDSLSIHEQADLLAQALLREHMHRRGFRHTLKAFDAECPRDARTIASRAAMRNMLNIPADGRPSRLSTVSTPMTPKDSSINTDGNGGSDPSDRVQSKKAATASTFMEELCSYRLTKREYAVRLCNNSADTLESERDPSDVEMAALEKTAAARQEQVHAAEAAIRQQQEQQQKQEAAAGALGELDGEGIPLERPPSRHQKNHSHRHSHRHHHHDLHRARDSWGDFSEHTRHSHSRETGTSPSKQSNEHDKHTDESDEDVAAEYDGQARMDKRGTQLAQQNSTQLARRAMGSAWQPPTTSAQIDTIPNPARYAVPLLTSHVLREAAPGTDGATWTLDPMAVRHDDTNMNTINNTSHTNASHGYDDADSSNTRVGEDARGNETRRRQVGGEAFAKTASTEMSESVRRSGSGEARAVWHPDSSVKAVTGATSNPSQKHDRDRHDAMHDRLGAEGHTFNMSGTMNMKSSSFVVGARHTSEDGLQHLQHASFTRGGNSSVNSSNNHSTTSSILLRESPSRVTTATTTAAAAAPVVPTSSILKPSTFPAPASFCSGAISRPLGWNSGKGGGHAHNEKIDREELAEKSPSADSAPPTPPKFSYDSAAIPRSSALVSRSTVSSSVSLSPIMQSNSAFASAASARASDSHLVCVGKDQRAGSPARLCSSHNTSSSRNISSFASTSASSWTPQSHSSKSGDSKNYSNSDVSTDGNNHTSAIVSSSNSNSSDGIRHGFGFHKTSSASGASERHAISRADSTSEGSSISAGALSSNGDTTGEGERRTRRANRKVTLILE